MLMLTFSSTRTHVRSETPITHPSTPFKAETKQPFAFGKGSQWADITAQIRAQIPVMLHHRLTPPPKETYSLNRYVLIRIRCISFLTSQRVCRKLSGAFLLASRLNATVDTKAIWDNVTRDYQFDT